MFNAEPPAAWKHESTISRDSLVTHAPTALILNCSLSERIFPDLATSHACSNTFFESASTDRIFRSIFPSIIWKWGLSPIEVCPGTPLVLENDKDLISSNDLLTKQVFEIWPDLAITPLHLQG